MSTWGGGGGVACWLPIYHIHCTYTIEPLHICSMKNSRIFNIIILGRLTVILSAPILVHHLQGRKKKVLNYFLLDTTSKPDKHIYKLTALYVSSNWKPFSNFCLLCGDKQSNRNYQQVQTQDKETKSSPRNSYK